MASPKGRHAATKVDWPVSTSDRRTFLTVLDEAVRSKPGMACGIVARDGVPVLHVINSEMPRHAAEIGADYTDGDWWYTWVQSGDTIGPVDDPDGVADVIAHTLKVNGQART